jgi:putative hydrolases of HD superfamily
LVSPQTMASKRVDFVLTTILLVGSSNSLATSAFLYDLWIVYERSLTSSKSTQRQHQAFGRQRRPFHDTFRMASNNNDSDPEISTVRVASIHTADEEAVRPISNVENPDEQCSSTLSSSDAAPAAALVFAKMVGRLKTTPRTGWVRRGVPRYESVADHSWRVAALSLLVMNDDNDTLATTTSVKTIDVGKCMQMAIVHDLAECLVGDIAPGDNVSKEDKQRMEEVAIGQIAATLRQATGSNCSSSGSGEPSRSETLLMDLFHEYEERVSDEAVAVKDLDLLDMILQANEYEERFGTDLTEFFDGTPVSRFRNPNVGRIAAHVHQQRDMRIRKELLESQDDAVSCYSDVAHDSSMSKSDAAFVAEYAKASSLGADAIQQVVLALRQWERPNAIPPNDQPRLL